MRAEPDVAIIGMAGRFPGARDIDEYWHNLRSGVESISFFSDDELVESGVDPALVRRPNYVKAAPVLDDPSLFDASFFGYAPREARFIDPQQRLFLECAWQALEHAGHDPERCEGQVGVFGGAAMNTYLLFSGLLPRFVDEYLLTLSGSDKDFLATRVSYKLNLTGPSVTVQSACSTSLVAVHLATQSLLYGECDMALAGGVSVRIPHRAGHLYREGSIFSPDGHCRPFDARAAGTIFGSGVGIVVLKRLADALADGDTIHATVKGSAINNDGAAKVNYSAPSIDRQAAAIAEALADADVDPATLSYIETHGTGTRVGDPIEIAALTRAFRASTAERCDCALGSVKSNVGHLDAAAGIAGLIKTVLALEHAEIPASLHFETPNPEIDWDTSPFHVNASLTPWPARATPRRAAVNALGVGGTNAHVVLEEAPPVPAAAPSRSNQLLVVSARSPQALDSATRALADHLAAHPAADLADVAHTLRAGRRPFERRRAVLCSGRRDAIAALRTLDSRRVHTGTVAETTPDVVYMLPGQGAQYAGMGRGLYRAEAVFRDRLDACAELLCGFGRSDLLESIGAPRRLAATATAQPAMFAIEYALAGLWTSWGLTPQALIGHSVGELTAACLAGVFSLGDALATVALRGQLMQELPPGAMLAVALSEDELRPYLTDALALAAVNGPVQSVVSGRVDAVAALERRLHHADVRTYALPVARAFHSPMTEAALGPFRDHLRGVELHPPRIPFVSNVTGTWIEPEQATDPDYWARHLRRTVRFGAGIEELLREPSRVLLEVGPGRTLSTLASQSGARVVLRSLGSPADGRTEHEAMLAALGGLWTAGVEVDVAAVAADERRRRLPLPTYPFERRRHWVGSAETTGGAGPAAAAVGAASEPNGNRDGVLQTMRTRARSSAGLTPVEAVVARAWRESLGVLAVGLRDNFYELGGHSILIPQVVGRINETFDIDLPLLSLVESPTVADLADCVEEVFRSTTRAAVSSVGEEEP